MSKKNINVAKLHLRDLPEIPLTTVLACCQDDEYGDARLFKLLFKDICAYDFLENCFYMTAGHHWIKDDAESILHLAVGFLSSSYIKAAAEINLRIKEIDKGRSEDEKEATDVGEQSNLKAQKKMLLNRADQLKQLRRVQRVLGFVKSDREMLVPHERMGKDVKSAWDRKTMLLAVKNGVLDLQTGKLTNGDPTDYIRTVAPTIWKGIDEPCPRFERFLNEILSDRQDNKRGKLIDFLQKLFGYGTTGSTKHHLFLSLLGLEGRNGKDTLLTILGKVLGLGFAGPVPKELFISTKKGTAGGAQPHKMTLSGKRLAWAEETDKGDSFDLSQIKEYTGGGAITGRGNYENFQTFDPTHFLILITNNPPHADATDKAFWDRICPIMLNVRYVDNPDPNNPIEYKPDKDLGEALEKEASGILAWLVRGCLAWQAEGLKIPEEVLRERANYKISEDTLGRFMEECCVIRKGDKDCKSPHTALYNAYKDWCIDNNLKVMSGVTFARDMEKRFQKTRPKNVSTYHGVGLRISFPLYADEDDTKRDQNETSTGNDDPDPMLNRERQFLKRCRDKGILVWFENETIIVECVSDRKMEEDTIAYIGKNIGVFNDLIPELPTSRPVLLDQKKVGKAQLLIASTARFGHEIYLNSSDQFAIRRIDETRFPMTDQEMNDTLSKIKEVSIELRSLLRKEEVA